MAAGDYLASFHSHLPQSGGQLGADVASDGDLTVVGAPTSTVGTETKAGLAQVFRHSTGELVATLKHPYFEGNDELGMAVAIHGTHVAVASARTNEVLLFNALTGDHLRTFTTSQPRAIAISATQLVAENTVYSGGVTVFDLASGAKQFDLSSPRQGVYDWFGNAVAIEGDHILVGAPRDDAQAINGGAVYVFSATTGAFQYKLSPPQPQRGLTFGLAVAAHDDRFVVGAFDKAFLFDATTGSFVATLDDGVATASYFGKDVAIDGATVVVTTPEKSVVRFDAETGTRLQTYLNPQPGSSNGYATAAAVAGSNIIVGVPMFDPDQSIDAGAALVLDAETGLARHTLLNTPRDGFWGNVAIAGDSTWVLSERAYVFDTRSGELKQSFFSPASKPDQTVAFSHLLAGSDEFVAIAGNQGEVYVYDANSGDFLRSLVVPEASSLSFGSVTVDGDIAVVGAPVARYGQSVGAVHFFDLRTGTLLRTISNPFPNPIGSNTPDHFGNNVAMFGSNLVVRASVGSTPTATQPRIYVFDTATGELKTTLSYPTLKLTSVYDVSDRFIAVAGELNYERPGIALFDVSTGKLVRYFRPQLVTNADFYSVKISGTQMAVGLLGREAPRILIYDLVNGSVREILDVPNAQAGAAIGYNVDLSDEYLLFGSAYKSDRGGVYAFDATWNDTPILTAGGRSQYAEDASPTFIASNATAFDYDSLNYAGGKLNITVMSGGSVDDRLNIRHEGMGPGQIGRSANQVLYGGVSIGTLVVGNQGRTLVLHLNDKATPAAVQAAMRRVSFNVLGDDPTPDLRTIRFLLYEADGTVSAPAKVEVEVKPFSLHPILKFAAVTRSYVENATPTFLDPWSYVTDQDSLHFMTGQLTVTPSGTSPDGRFAVHHQGTGAGHIGVSGASITYGGEVIGTWTGGNGSTPLVITFTSTLATPAAVSAMLRNLTFSSSSDNPAVGPHAYTVAITDGDGGVSNIVSAAVRVYSVNDPLQITLSATTSTYYEDGPAIRFAQDATISDPDGVDFVRGSLHIQISAGAQAGDRLSIFPVSSVPDGIGVQGRNVLFGGVVIGEILGAMEGPYLVISLNTSATLPAVQSLIRHVQYRTPSQAPVSDPRTVTFTLKDYRGKSFVATSQVAVYSKEDPPTVTFNNTEPVLYYVENGWPLMVARNAIVKDVDGANFNGGYLSLYLATDDAGDRLSVRNQGMASGQIAVNNSQVFFSGVLIGTLQQVSNGQQIKLFFNENATLQSIQAVARNIQFHTVSNAPTSANRWISWMLADKHGHASFNVLATIRVQPTNDAPYLGAGGSTGYQLNAAAIYLVAGAGVSDADSPDLNGGVLAVRVADGVDESNRLEIGGSFEIVGEEIRLQGVTIGIRNANGGVGTTDLEITFTSSATPDIAQQLLRAIRFRTVGGTSTASRTIAFTLTDGDGGTSNTVTKTVNVTA